MQNVITYTTMLNDHLVFENFDEAARFVQEMGSGFSCICRTHETICIKSYCLCTWG